MSLITELKRRNVFKVAAAYLVVGWVVIEVAATVAPQLALPEWVPRFITLLIVLGFPVAMVLAWIFDMTPDGVQVTEGGAGSKRFYAGVGVITAAMLGWYLYGTQDAGDSPASSSADAPPSIAVLAFDNMSPDPENAFFAEGISEEILNILAGVQGLKVASRTSAFSFKGKGTPIPEIARLLDVGHVLEGSVRKQGDRVRITAQLIDAATDAHLWSETYDRDLTDIFAVQEDIARAITAALEVVLGTRQVSVEAPTQNLEAYQLFLRGRTRFYQRVELDEATEDLRTAVSLDPEFAEAWTYLGAVTYVLRGGGYGTAQDPAILDAIAREAIDRALALNPDMPLALALHAQTFLNAPGAENFATGFALLERVASRVTEDSTPRMWLGMQYLQLGYIDRALATMQQVFEQDPLVPINNGYLGLALYMSGHEAEGILHAQRAAELSGGRLNYWLLALLGDLVARGEVERARTLLQDATPALTDDPSQSDREYFVAMYEAIAVLGDDAAEHALLEQLDASGWGLQRVATLSVGFAEPDYLIARVQATDDEYSLELALAAWLPAMTLREHPGYFAMMEHWGIAAYWSTNGYPPGCRLIESVDGNRLRCTR